MYGALRRLTATHSASTTASQCAPALRSTPASITSVGDAGFEGETDIQFAGQQAHRPKQRRRPREGPA